MLPTLVVRVYDKQQPVCFVEASVPVELGRQRRGEEELYSFATLPGRIRLVVAPFAEVAVSREHALVEMVGPERVQISNESKTLPIVGEDRTNLTPGQKREFDLPVLLFLGRRTVRLEAGKPTANLLNSLPNATRAPNAVNAPSAGAAPLPLSVTSSPDGATLFRWLQCVMDVLQVAATTESFYASAARALVELARLDAGRVLRWSAGGWNTVALFGNAVEVVSQTVLEHVRFDRRTYWQLSSEDTARAESLKEIASVVAAPILDRKGEVVAVLYGDRRRAPEATTQIAEFEARLVELLACGVAAGLERVEQEKTAIAAVTRFEAFFTPALARRLAAEPGLLDGKDRTVTVLFCDIRNFSRISEFLGAAGTVAWVGDVMSRLSDCVLDHQGVLVDYIGDELMAMWGAPDDQPDQAARACRAALDMVACLPELNARWEKTLGQAFSFGIGINSGPAHVGNTGSAVKFKYGPLGNTVNLASRVQGATKYLKCQLLVTGATKAQLRADFRTRRLCWVRVINIKDPVELFELAGADRLGWDTLRTGYEAALAAFQEGDFSSAARTIGNLVSQHPGDSPSLLLLARAANLLAEGTPEAFDPVWTLPGK